MIPPSPHPIPQHIFALTLQYLLPPTPPLPSHLISNNLLQRHYFLHIDPTTTSDPAAYFLWPLSSSDSSDGRIDALERLSSDAEALASAPFEADDIVYAVVDDATLQAKVGLGLELQVVFTLDSVGSSEEAEWRYHDVVQRREGGGYYTSLSEAISAHEAQDQSATENGGDQAADFWDGWGEEDGDATPAAGVVAQKGISDEEDADAAYFARYGGSDTSSHHPRTISDLPQIPTEGYNTPTMSEQGHATPLVSRSGTTELPAVTDSIADEAAMEIVRGAYRLWNSAAGGGRSKSEFLLLVDHAILQSD